MLLARIVVWICFPGIVILGPRGVYGQAYPGKPIRIVTSEAGGNSDFSSRLIARGIAGPLGQPIIVENRAGVMVGGVIVSKASPDGYTLLLTGNSLWIGALMEKRTYDPVRDFSPIAWVSSSPSILVVHPSVAAKSVKELIALAKTKPGELNFATNAVGTSSHLAGELFRIMAAVDIVGINYKGVALALNDLVSGRVQLMFASASSVASHVRSGRLRALAVTSARPSALAPDLPTVAASGVPGYEAEVVNALWAPFKTPAAIIKRLNQEVVRCLDTAQAKEILLGNGAEPVGGSPETLAAMMKSDITKWNELFKKTGIKAE